MISNGYLILLRGMVWKNISLYRKFALFGYKKSFMEGNVEMNMEVSMEGNKRTPSD